jgi:hypothetical protein
MCATEGGHYEMYVLSNERKTTIEAGGKAYNFPLLGHFLANVGSSCHIALMCSFLRLSQLSTL